MKSWNSWLLSLCFAGCCVACAGCGGGDVPDPDADENAAAEPAPAAPAGPTGPAAAPAEVAEKGGAAPAEPSGAATVPGAPAEATARAKAAGGDAGKAAPADSKEAEAPPVVAEGSSSAAQMLALGNRSAPAAAPEQGGATAEGSTSSAAGGPPTSGGIPSPSGGIPNPMANPMAIPGPQLSTSEAAARANAGVAPGTSPEMAARQAAEMANNAPGPGAPGGIEPPGAGYPGGEGGNAGGDNGPADFRSPFGAVKAFLSALRQKNPEKLAEATARRAATEAESAKNQKLFNAILEQSLTEDDLNELANKLEGFQIEGNNQPKSTGRFTIILGKTSDSGDYYRRTITTRREKDGWKVLDIGGQGVIDRPQMIRGRTTRPRGR